MQAASDIFLGWTRGRDANRYFYWRQLRDMKGSALVEALSPFALASTAQLCGWTLARAHARSGDPIASASTSGTTTPSTTPSPTSPPATPTRTSATTRTSSARSGPGGCRRWKAPDHLFIVTRAARAAAACGERDHAGQHRLQERVPRVVGTVVSQPLANGSDRRDGRGSPVLQVTGLAKTFGGVCARPWTSAGLVALVAAARAAQWAARAALDPSPSGPVMGP